MKKIIALFVTALLVVPGFAFAQGIPTDSEIQPFEHILSYASDITIQPDRTLAVTEKITVYADGTTIRHGIYRDFPTKYKDNFGSKYNIHFTLMKVLMDGKEEPYHTESKSNGTRIYIGDPDILLTPGIYTYEIRYTVTRELGFFKDHDELYWNVTGNGWEYQIDTVHATVHLPTSVPQDSVHEHAYTGAYGSTAQDYTVGANASGIGFSTTKPLQPTEGLTVVVTWPKGYIAPPSLLESIIDFSKDNWVYTLEILFALGIFLTYFIKWWKDGRDPKTGTIIAEYKPPQGLSPAALRYLSKEGYDNVALVASIISLAVQKSLRIEENNKLFGKSYKLVRTAQTTAYSDETPILETLFPSDSNEFLPSSKNYMPLLEAKKSQEDLLKKEFQPKYFVTNSRFITALGTLSIVAYVVISLLAAQFVGGELPVALLIVLVIPVHILFMHLLKRRTPEGQKLMEKIEGFKLFLSVTEKDRLNFTNPPERTPELFERYLPYALALEVGNKWAEQFASVFSELEKNGHGYIPIWYVGNSFSPDNVSGFASGLSTSFASTISSSSRAPGSSSGSGGSSGGGGGGGGGGGW